ncbi:hypothetical protein H4R20_003913 [Coemansia guatemalensis]|uniref:Ribosome biogenesis protein NOP53 n=1 Tax=Coemansia guatemalensis TaxID=2761395 RepID=A0A9W8HSR0_9FUNG|nr:hypothetical protein H4R20_003913 [Coemansia guatemalensis]
MSTALEMSSATSGAIKKTRGGRKSKSKSEWRKKIDLDDVEVGLEELREEERQGGTMDRRQDIDLFTVDTGGDEKTRARTKAKKGLRVDEILGKRSSVASPVVGSKLSEERRKRRAAQEVKRQLRKIAGFSGDRRTAPQGLKADRTAQNFDIWGASSVSTDQPAKKRKALLSRQKLAHLAELPAVEVAHPGASYRPTPADHKKLVQSAADEYALKLREEGKYSQFKSFNGVQGVDGAIECAEFVMEEMMRGEADVVDADADAKADGNSENEGSNDEEANDEQTVHSDSDPEDTASTSKDPKRKTRAERNRQKRAIQRRFEERRENALRQQLHKLEMAKKLGQLVDKDVDLSEQTAARRHKLMDEKRTKPLKRLGKYDVPKLPEAVKLADELPCSLRQLQPETSSVADAYNSFIKRNFIEPRAPTRPVPAKPRKIKTTEKWSYKDFK